MDPQQEKIQKMIEQVTKAAKADGKITDEEEALLESVQINVLTYDMALEHALEDGYITEEEQETLLALKQQILNDAWDIARVSEGVSEDELKMLDILIKSIEDNSE